MKKRQKRLKTGTAVDSLNGQKARSFIELYNLLKDLPGFESFTVEPPTGERLDTNSFATKTFLTTLWDQGPHPICLKVHHDKRTNLYFIGAEFGPLWFEIGHGNIRDLPKLP